MDENLEGVTEVHDKGPLHVPEWIVDPVWDVTTAPPHTDKRGKKKQWSQCEISSMYISDCFWNSIKYSLYLIPIFWTYM